MSDYVLACGKCGRTDLVREETVKDETTYRTASCPEHGVVLWQADAGTLDLGLVTDEQLKQRDNRFEIFP